MGKRKRYSDDGGEHKATHKEGRRSSPDRNGEDHRSSGRNRDRRRSRSRERSDQRWERRSEDSRSNERNRSRRSQSIEEPERRRSRSAEPEHRRRSRSRSIERRRRSRSRSIERRQSRERSDRSSMERGSNKPELQLKTMPPESFKKVEPISLERLKSMKQDALQQQAKPVFLSKKQREELAMKQREDEEAERRRRKQQQQQETSIEQQQQKQQLVTEQQQWDRDRDRERRAAKQEEQRQQDELRREQRERDRELECIKEHYLGVKKVKKRVAKPSDKFRFAFDWEAAEDTSRDTNPIYQNPHEARLLFGRGFRAGVDRREQKKLAARSEEELRSEKMKNKNSSSSSIPGSISKSSNEERGWSDKALEEMTERDWRIFKEDFGISYRGTRLPRPMRRWEESGLEAELLRAVAEAGYAMPSPIQMAAIPLGMQLRDVIGVAETGSGKTAAFLLPLLSYVSRLPPMGDAGAADGPYAVVLAPTRELAQQIEQEAARLCRHLGGVSVSSVVGGKSAEEQGARLRQGCEVVVATPGRLLDAIERRYAVLNQCSYLVLDEADRMISMELESVLEAMPPVAAPPPASGDDRLPVARTTHMFSATMPAEVERLARRHLVEPVVVTAGRPAGVRGAIAQRVEMLSSEADKPARLAAVLAEELDGGGKAIVFVNARRAVDPLARQLSGMGFRAAALHGDSGQARREASLAGFRGGGGGVLVATDVAGRGIDVADVALVVNYDMPGDMDKYTHRIGRTGRAGRAGTATTFLTAADAHLFYELKQHLLDSNCPVPPELARHEAARCKPGSVPDRPPRRSDETLYAQ